MQVLVQDSTALIASCGVPALAVMPIHPDRAKAGSFSSSTTVGTLGNRGSRCFENVRSGTIFPVYMNGAAVPATMTIA